MDCPRSARGPACNQLTILRPTFTLFFIYLADAVFHIKRALSEPFLQAAPCAFMVKDGL